MTLYLQQVVDARAEGTSLFKLLDHRNEEPALLSLQDFLRRRTQPAAALDWILLNQDLFHKILSDGKLRCLRVLFHYAPELLLQSAHFNAIAWGILTARSDRNDNTALQHMLVECLAHGLTKCAYTDLPHMPDGSVLLSAQELFGRPDKYISISSYTLAAAYSYSRLPELNFLDDDNRAGFRDYVLSFYAVMATLEDKLDEVPNHAPHSAVCHMQQALRGRGFNADNFKMLLAALQINSRAQCSDSVPELKSITPLVLFGDIMHSISTQRTKLAVGYWRNVWRARYASLCFALQALELPAPILLAIADTNAPWLIAVALPLHYKWKTIVHIKHARETGKL